MRFGPEAVMHNVITFFGAKFPQSVENSSVLSLATIPVTDVVVPLVPIQSGQLVL